MVILLQIAFTFVVYPSLILAYMGQAAYLSKHHIIESDYRIGFYVSVPGTNSSLHFNLQLEVFGDYSLVYQEIQFL